MPLAFGPWKRTTTTTSRSSSPALNAACTSSWNEKPGRRLDNMALRRHRGGLDDGAAQIAVQHRKPPVGWNGFFAAAQHGFIAARRGRRRHFSPPSVQHRLGRIGARPAARTVRTSSCSSPAASNSRIKNPMPPAA
jgi:hypothetical protein